MIEQVQIEDIINVLDEGGIILYPTDTIWSIGCDALQESAIKKIHHIKERPIESPMTVLVDSLEMLKLYVPEIHPKIETLLAYHERPLTVLYNNVRGLPDLLFNTEGEVAIRIVMDSFCKQLIESFGRPIIATSANKYKEDFPSFFGQTNSDIITAVDHIVKHRQNDKVPGEPSVIIKLSKKGELIFVRS